MPICEHCGHETPDETFCTWCGAHRVLIGPSARRRIHHYAAAPGEHVAQPSVISTLFPHLPSHRVHEFRWGLVGGLLVVVGLVAGGLVVAAVLTAAVLVPVLYLVYLYEAQVYRDAPAQVIGLTMAAGAALGVLVVSVANAVVPSRAPLDLQGATGVLVVATVLLPAVEEVLKPIPAFTLRRLKQFDQTIDGLVFGIAAGLGFAAAETLVDFSRIVSYEPLHTSSGSWLFPLLGVAVLSPLMQASCTGAIVASLWRRNQPKTGRLLYVAGIPVAITAHVAFSFVSRLIANQGANQATVLVWQAVVVAALLVYIRFLVHDSLLAEAEAFGYEMHVCPNCRRHLEAAAFCPHCGAAFAAGSRLVHGGLASEAPTPSSEGG